MSGDSPNVIRQLAHLLLASVLTIASSVRAEELKLPTLGEGSNSLFSPEQEYNLGRAWLRMFRSQVRTFDDPIVHDYLESLLFKLVAHSKLQDRRIELVVVDNPTLNAFAVPGGVIGIHTGLLLYAQTEDELATVLAHELAHLSQRHFSRGVEAQQQQATLTMAGLLAEPPKTVKESDASRCEGPQPSELTARTSRRARTPPVPMRLCRRPTPSNVSNICRAPCRRASPPSSRGARIARPG